jgi:uncharacterized protein (TIGR03083 family)
VVTVGEIEAEALRSHDAGVQAIVELAGSLSQRDWSRPSGCGAWTSLDLAGHVLTVINLWDHILDRALAGDESTEFPWDQFDAWNAKALADLPAATGPERIEEFAGRADHFYNRLAAAPDVGFGTPAKTLLQCDITTSVFTSYALLEWHLHAHDLAVAAGTAYHPEEMDPPVRAVRVMFPSLPNDRDVNWNVMIAGRP